VDVVAALDLERSEVERGDQVLRVKDSRTPMYGVMRCLRMWERLIGDMERRWDGVDYLMVYEYLNDLSVRNSLDEFAASMPVR